MWQKRAGLSFIYYGARKKFAGASESSRINVDSAPALDHYFFEARKKASMPASGPVWVAPQWRREDIMKKFAAAMLAGVAMSLTLASVAEAK
ncbi:MAG: hypothetical protein E5V46_31835, partial [Mesorhizobium sp.]